MESNQANSSALRAFRLLESLAQRPAGKAMSELMHDTGLPKQTVHRIVDQLIHAGLVVKFPGDKHYQLGRRAEFFALSALLGSPRQQERRAILESLVNDLGETCNITTLVGTDIVYIDRVESSWPLRVVLGPGSHVPVYATASGKLLLSLLPKPQRDRLIELIRLRSLTPNTHQSIDTLQKDLTKTRRERLGINSEEHWQGLIAVAVPVMLTKEKACAAIAVQAPVGRKTLDALTEFVPRMRIAAQDLAKTFAAND